MAILAKLKQINNFNIPVVLMSKDSNVEYNNDYLQAGFNDIIIKPINKDTLLNIINTNKDGNSYVHKNSNF